MRRPSEALAPAAVDPLTQIAKRASELEETGPGPLGRKGPRGAGRAGPKAGAGVRIPAGVVGPDYTSNVTRRIAASKFPRLAGKPARSTGMIKGADEGDERFEGERGAGDLVGFWGPAWSAAAGSAEGLDYCPSGEPGECMRILARRREDYRSRLEVVVPSRGGRARKGRVCGGAGGRAEGEGAGPES